MNLQLDMHPASEAERIDVFRNVHDVWSRGLDLETHLERRLKSVQHNRARWFVGCIGGRVVTSLGAYPLSFRLQGRITAGFAIGAVHTLADFRGRGLAPQLIRFVEDRETARGAKVALLYSDIDPDYYARLGYRLCSSLEGWHEMPGENEFCKSRPSRPGNQPSRLAGPAPTVAGSTPPASAAAPRLMPIDAAEALSMICHLYEQFHSSLAISIARDEVYWQYLLHKSPADGFYQLMIGNTEAAGYVRTSMSARRLTILDYALVDHSPQFEQALYAALAELARARSAESLGGWLPETPAAREYFSIRPRAREVTMLKPLAPDVHIDAGVISAAQHLHEIDHV